MLGLGFALALGGGSDLRISVITFGPGDHPFFKFGHNAILVQDTSTGRDLVYNYGMFAFDSPMLIPKFMQGKFRYWMGVDSLRGTMAGYRYENRTMVGQEIQLSEEEKRELVVFLASNALPANKYYKYDYYMDNCSTRVRDVIDRATGGAVHAANKAPAEMSFREHTRRLTQDDLLVYLGLDIVMADFIDRPIDQWDEMFLPAKLQEGLGRAARNGTPIVSATDIYLNAPGRAPLKAAPPKWHPWFLLAGLAAGALCFVPFTAATGVLALFAGLFGFFGCVFVMLWVATDHVVAYGNENIFQCAPWGIVFFGLVRGLLKNDPARVAFAAKLALGAAVFSAIGLVAKVFPAMNQTNAEFICFFLPFWTGAAVALRRRVRA